MSFTLKVNIFDLHEQKLTEIQTFSLPAKSKKAKSEIIVTPFKTELELWPNMVNSVSSMPLSTNKVCWGNCRSTFENSPLGCPIEFYPEPVAKRDITSRENLFKSMNLPTNNGLWYFDTEGIFCSLGCVKGYILDELAKNRSPKYKRALTLLTLMVSLMFGSSTAMEEYHATSSWKMLKDYGGQFTPASLRSGIKLQQNDIDLRRPVMFPTVSYCVKN